MNGFDDHDARFAHRLERKRKFTPNQQRTWIGLYQSGLTVAAIAEQVGASRQSVQRYLSQRLVMRTSAETKRMQEAIR